MTALAHSSPSRIVVVLGGLNSRSLTGSGMQELRGDFRLLRAEIGRRTPDVRFVSFCYATAGATGWAGGDWDEDADPVYGPEATTNRPLECHVENLDRLVGAIRRRYPLAGIDLVGFSLGGLVAAAWVGLAPDLSGINRLGLISTPVGGITPLGHFGGMPPVRSMLRQFEIDFGDSLIFRDIRTGSPWLDAVWRAADRIEVAAIENASDYVVNGRRIAGQVLFPEWIRTIALGRGAWVSGWLPAEQCYWRNLGGWDRELRQTHHLILRSGSKAVREAHAWLAERLMNVGEHAFTPVASALTPSPSPRGRGEDGLVGPFPRGRGEDLSGLTRIGG